MEAVASEMLSRQQARAYPVCVFRLAPLSIDYPRYNIP